MVGGLTKFAETNVYIGGEVGKPGMVHYRQGLTPIQAVSAAGGFLESASTDNVVLTRTGVSLTDSISRRLSSFSKKSPPWLAP